MYVFHHSSNQGGPIKIQYCYISGLIPQHQALLTSKLRGHTSRGRILPGGLVWTFLHLSSSVFWRCHHLFCVILFPRQFLHFVCSDCIFDSIKLRDLRRRIVQKSDLQISPFSVPFSSLNISFNDFSGSSVTFFSMRFLAFSRATKKQRGSWLCPVVNLIVLFTRSMRPKAGHLILSLNTP